MHLVAVIFLSIFELEELHLYLVAYESQEAEACEVEPDDLVLFRVGVALIRVASTKLGETHECDKRSDYCCQNNSKLFVNLFAENSATDATGGCSSNIDNSIRDLQYLEYNKN